MAPRKQRLYDYDQHEPDVHIHLDPAYPYGGFYAARRRSSAQGSHATGTLRGTPSQVAQQIGKIVQVLRSRAPSREKVIDLPASAWRMYDRLTKLPSSAEAWRHAIKGRGELLALWHPNPHDPGERSIIEAAIHVSPRAYAELRASGEFDVLSDGVLARRGRKKRATNIFIIPSRRG
jgi:hypothetical protein